ncbi:MAG: hypothetical protein HIU91_01700 [Acidobacteria bacterium]|nr:hypothetical protein [Acidobacteriota bacterium]
MASTPLTDAASPDLQPVPAPVTHPVAELAICLPAFSAEALPSALEAITTAFPGESVLIASSVLPPTPTDWPTLELVPYTSPRSDLNWVLTASDYAAAARLAADHNTRAVLILGDPESPLDAPMLRRLADGIRGTSVDLILPRFSLGPTNALVNTALLYPLSRALFGADIRFPLPVDAAISARMAQRLLPSTQRLVSLNQGSTILWPVAEAAIAGYSVREISAGDALPPTPPSEDFNTLFSSVAGSLFADIDAKATFWQRARNLPLRPPAPTEPAPLDPLEATPDVLSMIESFHLAQNNLQEIWSLVLPPQSRLALKKLSQLAPDAFTMEPDLWARIVYDFTLAFHLRTLNRNHLLGAMTPLYLAWAASYLRSVADRPDRAAHAIERNATAFESEKSYIVSRWRWPDRFNP